MSEPYRRLWGRAKGRPLSPYQAGLVQNLLPRLAVGESPLAALDKFETIDLEIGFGGGEHLLHQARNDPSTGFIGAEPFLTGVAKALAGIDKDGLANINLHHGDVRPVLDNFPDGSINNIYMLYPDPWPKPRHFKRRLIQEHFISELHRVLKPGGELRFASDIPSYADWALARILKHGGFDWPAGNANDWLSPYPDWPSTRYEAKALREGRTPHYFNFIKHLD